MSTNKLCLTQFGLYTHQTLQYWLICDLLLFHFPHHLLFLQNVRNVKKGKKSKYANRRVSLCAVTFLLQGVNRAASSQIQNCIEWMVTACVTSWERQTSVSGEGVFLSWRVLTIARYDVLFFLILAITDMIETNACSFVILATTYSVVTEATF